jgi:hypothetical protein
MNFIEQLNNINHETLKNIYNELGNISDDIFIKSYSKLMEFVKRSIIIKDKITLIGIAHLVYGWMPTMLDNIDENFIKDDTSVKNIWDGIISGSLEKSFLESIKKITNNSIIGGSKLLHFINPKDYAIIDSNILKYILNKKYVDNYKNIDSYILFMKRLKELEKNRAEMEQIKNIFHENNSNLHEFSDLRYIEMALFYSGRK